VLREAVHFTKQFIGDNISNPGLSLCRLKADGTINTGDGKAISIYKSSSFSGEFKLKDTMLDGVMGFVDRCDGKIELLEGDNHYFFRNTNGHYFGFNKVSYDLPVTNVQELFKEEVGDTIFQVDCDKLAGAIRRLKWSLDKDVKRMGFKIQGTGVSTKLMVTAKDTNGSVSEEEVEGVVRTKGDGETQFFLNYENVVKGLGHLTKPQAHFCINSTGTLYAKIIEGGDKADGTSGALKFNEKDANSANITKILFLSLMKRDR
jgi:hypothetical protein